MSSKVGRAKVRGDLEQVSIPVAVRMINKLSTRHRKRDRQTAPSGHSHYAKKRGRTQPHVTCFACKQVVRLREQHDEAITCLLAVKHRNSAGRICEGSYEAYEQDDEAVTRPETANG